MENIVICGAQLGDESKGKQIDYLASDFNTIVRFQGAANAGHTLWVNGKKTVLHLIPSGILHPGKINVIATGVMVDPLALLEEINDLRNNEIDVSPRNLKIAANCSVVTSIHRAIDAYEEDQRGDNKIGTTKRGVGPAVAEKVSRCGIKLYDLLKKDKMVEYMPRSRYAEFQNKLSLNKDYDTFIGELLSAGLELKDYLIDTSLYLDEACKRSGVLFEGAQSVMLDVDYGSYPFVTSSHCVAGYASVGCGISPKYIDEILGVIKCYNTRVGTGPFPTEIIGKDAEFLREKGGEYGATTGRPRKVGWLDLVALKYAVRVGGITSLALSKLDVLADYNTIRVCNSYTINGELFYNMPVDHSEVLKAAPNYIEFDGWSKEDLDKLPNISKPLENFINYITDYVGVPIKLLSFGPDRYQTIKLF